MKSSTVFHIQTYMAITFISEIFFSSGRDRFRSRVQVNNLIVRVAGCKGLKKVAGKEMRVYVAFGVYGGRDVVSVGEDVFLFL